MAHLKAIPLSSDIEDDYTLPLNDSNIFTVTFGVGSGGDSSMRISSGSGDSTVETAMISAVEDAAVEGDHEFTVSIQSTSPPAMLGVSSVVATIMDDDRKSTLKCELFQEFMLSYNLQLIML